MRSLLIAMVLLLIPSALFAQARVNTDKRYGSYSFIDGAAIDTLVTAKYIEGIIIGTPIDAGTVTIASGVAVQDTFVVLTLGATAPAYPIYIPIQARCDSATISVTEAGMKTTVIYQTER